MSFEKECAKICEPAPEELPTVDKLMNVIHGEIVIADDQVNAIIYSFCKDLIPPKKSMNSAPEYDGTVRSSLAYTLSLIKNVNIKLENLRRYLG